MYFIQYCFIGSPVILQCVVFPGNTKLILAKSGYKTAVAAAGVKEATACSSNTVLVNTTKAEELRRARPILKHITICGIVFFCPCDTLIVHLYPGLKEGF